ncbi:Lon protease-like protein, mitochondrial [Globomyces pollinis-pini]|nr:Lon protease-like protein, mitochondrial [Globomyces pollinis-pini]
MLSRAIHSVNRTVFRSQFTSTLRPLIYRPMNMRIVNMSTKKPPKSNDKDEKSEDVDEDSESQDQNLKDKPSQNLVDDKLSSKPSSKVDEAQKNDQETKPKDEVQSTKKGVKVSSRKSNKSPSTKNGLNQLNFKTTNPPEHVPNLLAIPLSRRPLFPGFFKSMYIKDPRAIETIKELVKNGTPYVGIFLAKNESLDKDIVTDMDEIEKIGVLAQITNTYPTGTDESSLTVVVYPQRRIRITEFATTVEQLSSKPIEKVESTEKSTPTILETLKSFAMPVVTVEDLADEPFNSENRVIKATTSEIINVLKEISQSNPLLRDQIITVSVQTGNLLLDPSKLADFAAAISSGEPSELQSVLESLVVEEKLHKALVVLKKELANAKLQQEISQEVDKKISRKNQEYFLMEQLKGIKKELGLETDGKEKMIQSFKDKAAALEMPEQILKVFNDEIQKLSSLEPQASEFNVTRNYLDWLTQIPWGQRSDENFDIKTAKVILDEDHYGLKDVKDRILEFIAVGKLRGSVEGKIITMVGPPGVGKTSVGKSIARALGREFYRFSVGGLTDVAEIKGHRRTYVGAMPGKVVQALKKVKTENPLIMIDEIDKLGRGHQGDPASALLELLDPEQNSSFLDHYMDVPIDLSQVLFVCTANTLETIPGPLADRMEIITLSGYVAEEKVAIAAKYLAPQSIEACGLQKYKVNLTDSAISTLIKNYCRENGVRNLKKHIDKIYRKAAFKIISDEDKYTKDTEITITDGNLKEYVGSPVFTSERMYDTTPPGIVMGLAWTSMGGSSLYIESVVQSRVTDESKPSFNQTGQLGDVMKESSTIAYTFAKSFMVKHFPENTFFDHAQIHMHVPEGATPKDGPSAGSTITTSLLSLALDTPVLQDVAMTGEITLTGKVLRIGGVKEKAIAAKRSGVKTIIFPKSNQSDWDELDDYLKENLDPHFVSWYDEIYTIVFPEIKLHS